MSNQIQVLSSKFDKNTLKEVIGVIKKVRMSGSLEDIRTYAKKQLEKFKCIQVHSINGCLPQNLYILFNTKSTLALYLNSIKSSLLFGGQNLFNTPLLSIFQVSKTKHVLSFYAVNKFNIEVVSKLLTDQNTQKLINFVTNFYGTFFYQDKDFQFNLITFVKHFISKVSLHSYWHCVMDDNNKLAVSNKERMSNFIRLRIKGFKEGYDKQLYLFSLQGERQSILSSLKNKWVQLISFMTMLLLFASVVGCGSEQTEGICQHRDTIILLGAGIMFAVMGLKIASRKKENKMMKETMQKKDK